MMFDPSLKQKVGHTCATFPWSKDRVSPLNKPALQHITQHGQSKRTSICVCTCSERDPVYFLDMRFLIVSLTDLTFFPREMRDVVGDFTASLYKASCSLCQRERDRKRAIKHTESQLNNTTESQTTQLHMRAETMKKRKRESMCTDAGLGRVDHMERTIRQVKSSKATRSLQKNEISNEFI